MNLLTHCAICGERFQTYQSAPWRPVKTLPCTCNEATVRILRHVPPPKTEPERAREGCECSRCTVLRDYGPEALASCGMLGLVRGPHDEPEAPTE